MLEEAMKHAKTTQLEFFFQDAQNQAFYQQYPNMFDLVVSFTVLHWIHNQQAVLEGIRTALKPNGKFYLRICSNGGDPIQEIADHLKTSKYRTIFNDFIDPMRRFNVQEYSKLLEESNLVEISIKEVQDCDVILDREKLAKQVKSWLPHYHFLQKSKTDNAEGFINDVIDNYLQKFPPKNHQIFLYDHYLEVVGQKKKS